MRPVTGALSGAEITRMHWELLTSHTRAVPSSEPVASHKNSLIRSSGSPDDSHQELAIKEAMTSHWSISLLDVCVLYT